MGLTSQLENGGWGALALYVYSLLIFLHWDIPLVDSYQIAIVLAAVPSLLVMFIVVVANDRLNDYWAGGNLKESTETIGRITGESDFYQSASAEIQDAVDNFDEKGYSHHVSILSGILIAITAPVTGYFAIGWLGALTGVLVSGTSVWALSVRSLSELNRLATNLSTPYEEKYENQ